MILVATVLSVPVSLFMVAQVDVQNVGKAAPQEAALPVSPTKHRPAHCPDARRGVAWYRERAAMWRAKMGRPAQPGRKPRNCADARYLANVWRVRAKVGRREYAEWWQRMTNDAVLSIRYVFGEYAVQALAVAWCESRLSRHAHNGQYLGLFQMGSSERRIFGHGETFYEQAVAAHRYFVSSGRDWSPWSCKP